MPSCKTRRRFKNLNLNFRMKSLLENPTAHPPSLQQVMYVFEAIVKAFLSLSVNFTSSLIAETQSPANRKTLRNVSYKRNNVLSASILS